MSDTRDILHATTIAVDGLGLMILGASGSGKSSLALQLMGLGAGLVADDRTIVTRTDNQIIASAPETIVNKIEARGVGIIQASSVGPIPVALVVDLDCAETERLPHPHTKAILGVTLPCLHNADSGHFPSAILLYMKAMVKTPL